MIPAGAKPAQPLTERMNHENSSPCAALPPSNPYGMATGGGPRAVLDASRGGDGTLVVVVETVGSTYVRRGAIALFGSDALQVGWLSGGCLEADIALRARQACADQRIEWMDIDTREDEDLFSGSATGCRGRLRLALLPLAALAQWQHVASAWLNRHGPLTLDIASSGAVTARCGTHVEEWQVAAAPPGWADGDAQSDRWQIVLSPPPSVVVFGAGPETALLVPLLRALGWMTTVVDRRERWMQTADAANRVLAETPSTALARLHDESIDGALVMHHNFELDREALFALACHGVAFVGLLGPRRRREDLFSVLPVSASAALLPRLRSPIGLDIGGHGPEAIALSIAAELHAWRHAK